VVSLFPSNPIAGQDYPRDWGQFLDWFHGEEACLEFLEKLRWPQGFVCPRCNQANEPFRASRKRLVCRICRQQCSVTAGTIFEKTRTPMRSWFAAAWYVTNQKHGVSALGLQSVLGLGGYQTAWTMLHRLRRVMVRPGRERLSGVVEVDETHVGGVGRNTKKPKRLGSSRAPTKPPRGPKAIVAVTVEVHEPKGFGRIRLRRVPNASERYLLPFVQDSIEPGSLVRTDGSFAYRSLPEYGYPRHRIVHVGSDDPAHVTMPGVHRIAALLKRWLLGTHQGAVRSRQLDSYLDEYTFRFNRRTSRSRGLLFYRLLQQAVVTEPITYNEVAASKG